MAGSFELYLIRHGLAEDRGPDWPDDGKRPLTAEGLSRLGRSACGLVRLGWELDVILTSPLTRARQTAEVVAEAMAVRPPIVLSAALAPEGRLPALMADLAKQARRSRIALVGHQPGIGELAARLTGLPGPLDFKKGTICRVDVGELPPDGPGALRWFVPPKLLRALRR